MKVKKCFHYTNLQPLWWNENLSKRINMKNKTKSLINKPDFMPCWSCNSEGSIIINEAHPLVRKECDVCHGTGQWVENHYIVIDNKNKIAIDSDTGG